MKQKKAELLNKQKKWKEQVAISVLSFINGRTR